MSIEQPQQDLSDSGLSPSVAKLLQLLWCLHEPHRQIELAG
jgi:hypothetical protein